MEDDNSMSDRILRTIENIINTDPELKEFTIIPVEHNIQNKSPVLYEEHNIGLESWCVKYIYRYAYIELFEFRKSKKSLHKDLNRLLSGVLLINPDVSTFWNMKRELIVHEVISVANELIFTKLVLSYKSKSNEAFGYRRWLLSRSKIPFENLVPNELKVCKLAANKSQNNYHAWTHRIWCITKSPNHFILGELEFSENWIGKHVSEHTGFHYRQFLFQQARDGFPYVIDFYYERVLQIFNQFHENDCDFLIFLLGKTVREVRQPNLVNYFCLLLYDLYITVAMLNELFPNHESIWYHRRYLMHHLIKASYEYHGLLFSVDYNLNDVTLYGTNIVNVDTSPDDEGETQPKLFKSQPNRVESSLLYQHLIKNETECLKTNSRQGELVKRYEKWLKYIIGVRNI